MPTRSVDLTAEQDAFVEEVIRNGRYLDAGEAMRDALNGLQKRLRADELRIDLLRTHVQAGIDAIDRGEFSEVSDDDLDAALEELGPPAPR